MLRRVTDNLHGFLVVHHGQTPITAGTGRSLRDYAAARLFGPLGIDTRPDSASPRAAWPGSASWCCPAAA